MLDTAKAGQEAEAQNRDPAHSDKMTQNQEAGTVGSEEKKSGVCGEQVAAQNETAEKVLTLEKELSELKDQYLRRQADFENYRKRMVRERQELELYATTSILNDIIPVIDNFERAIRSAETNRDFDSFHNGIAMIEKELVSMLERKWGLKRFDSEGTEFDPQRHEALLSEMKEGLETPTVVEDYQKGYMLHERVIRTARVKVALPLENVKNTNQVTGDQ